MNSTGAAPRGWAFVAIGDSVTVQGHWCQAGGGGDGDIIGGDCPESPHIAAPGFTTPISRTFEGGPCHIETWTPHREQPGGAWNVQTEFIDDMGRYVLGPIGRRDCVVCYMTLFDNDSHCFYP
jgi:hypothetical protein